MRQHATTSEAAMEVDTAVSAVPVHQPVGVSPQHCVLLMQPPSRPSQSRQSAAQNSITTSATPTSTGTSNRSPPRAVRPNAAAETPRAPPGSRRLVWRAVSQATAAATSHSSNSSFRPRSQLTSSKGASRHMLPAVGVAAAAAAARVKPAVDDSGDEAGVVLSLGSLGTVVLPPYPSSGGSTSAARRRDRFGELAGEVETTGPNEEARGISSRRCKDDVTGTANASGQSLQEGDLRAGRGQFESDVQGGRPQRQHSSGGGSDLGGSDLFTLIKRCRSRRELQQLQLENSGRLLPQHIPALMAAAVKLQRSPRGDPGTQSQSYSRPPSSQDGSLLTSNARLRESLPQGLDLRANSWPSSAQHPPQQQQEEEEEQSLLLQYMWELAASALRLARSRELPARSVATALWAVAKLPLDPAPATGTTPVATASAGPIIRQLEQRQPQRAIPCPPAPCKEEWQLWAREMIRCCCSGSWSSSNGGSVSGGGYDDNGPSAKMLLGEFSPQDVSQTLWAVATLDCAPLPRGFLPGLLSAAKPRLSIFGPQALSNTLWALSRLRCQPPSDWLNATCAVSTRQLSTFNAQALATTVAALAHMEYTPSPKWCEAFFAACEECMWPHRRPQPAFLEKATPGREATACYLAPAALAPPPKPAPQALAQTAWAVARLQLSPPPGWLDGLAGAAAAAGSRLNGQDVANILWALGAMRYRYPSEIAEDPYKEPEAGASASGSRRNVVQQEQQQGQMQPEGRAEDLLDEGRNGNGTWPGGRPGTNAAPRLAPLLAAWRRCVDSMQPQQLSACLVASVHLGLSSGVFLDLSSNPTLETAPTAVAPQQVVPMLAEVVDRTLGALGRRLAAASGQAVANSLWAVARLGCRPSSSWVGAAVERFMECLEDDDAGPQEVANVWWALGRLRWAPPADAVSELLSRSLALAGTGDLRSGELAAVLWAVSRLGLRLPKPVMDRLVRILRTSLHEEAQQQQPSGGAATDNGHPPPLPRPPARHLTPAPPATLVTLLRALAALQATSQRSTALALLERSLRHWAAALYEPTAAVATARASDRSGVIRGIERKRTPPVAAGATAARQVALALHSAASLGVTLALGPASSSSSSAAAAAGTRPGGASARGLAGAVVTALRAVLPYANTRDLAMALAAAASMEAVMPLGLLAAALQRAGELYGGVEIAASSSEARKEVASNDIDAHAHVGLERDLEAGEVDAGNPGEYRGDGDGDGDVEGLVRLYDGAVKSVSRSGESSDMATILCSLGKLLDHHLQRRAEMTIEQMHKQQQQQGVESGPLEAGDATSNNGRGDGMASSVDDHVASSQDVVEVAVKAAAAAATQTALMRWDELLRTRPRLREARKALLAAALARMKRPASASEAGPTSGAGAASGIPTSATAVQQLILGLSLSRLHPELTLLRPLARALVRVTGELPAGLMAACLSHLAAMGADMDPRVALVLIGRLRAVHIFAVPASARSGRFRGWVTATCGGVSCMVALWVLRRAQKTYGSGRRFAEHTLRTASPHNRAGRSRLRAAAARVDPRVMRLVEEALLQLREEGECRRLT
ncbi:hypothetical protein Vretimale_11596 [Volvox reticuliferus]|uniref:Uncharacterized protein n=1 Tax=Volvox reticuliferus TaxID=1737510 RepID=A0A8J4GHY9_9CHLO|nr:hypothetical protein Vretifemale_14835 [Volvox reticuliferus]GIM07463.1 hypothetical protein Vretimale_11596 [Volvox reticuliferus]